MVAERKQAGRLAAFVDDRPITAKVAAAVLVGVSAAVAVGVVGIARVEHVKAETVAIRDQGLAVVRQTETLRRAFLQTRLDALADETLGTSDSGPEHLAYLADVKNVRATAQALRAMLPAAGPAVAQLNSFEEHWQSYHTVVGGKLLDLARTGKMADFVALRSGTVKPVSKQVQASLDALVATVGAETDARVAAATEAAVDTRRTLITIMSVASILALLLGWLVSRRIVRAVRLVSGTLERLRDGDLTATAQVGSADELGRMGAALDTAILNLRELVSTIDQSSASLSAATEEMSSTAAQIAASADESAAQARVVSSTADVVSTNVQTMAAGSEEMAASIKEIAGNATEAARVASCAVEVTRATNLTVTKLGDSSREIGDVIKVITSIAEQTNLLALNATIEAARAGEAGKGFAVVASEVKDLAQETARATDDISRRVEAIQTDTAGAVAAIAEIAAVIQQISDFQVTIAGAVEEQTATTAEMGRNVAQAAAASGDIAGNISGVATAAQVASEGVGQTRQAVSELARMSSHLQQLVYRFRY